MDPGDHWDGHDRRVPLAGPLLDPKEEASADPRDCYPS